MQEGGRMNLNERHIVDDAGHLGDMAQDELRAGADRMLGRQCASHTLQAAALVHGADLKLDEALESPKREEERAARIVELRFLGDLPMRIVAEHLDILLRTAEREWCFARAWLLERLSPADRQ